MLIGIFAALIVGGFALVVMFIDRQLRLTGELIVAHIDALDAKLGGKLDGLGKNL